MAGYQADAFYSARQVWQNLLDGEHAGGQLYRSADSLMGSLPILVGAQTDAHLLRCKLLGPSHAKTPKFQFKSFHCSPRHVHVLRNGIGEILSHYARFAHGVMLGGGFGG